VSNMPELSKLDIQFTSEEYRIFQRIVNKGHLRASRPPIASLKSTENGFVYANDGDKLKNRAAYVWRNVAFYCSPKSQHKCMPVTADWWIVKEDRQFCNALVDKIINAMPLNELRGVVRWGQALGMLE